MITRRALQTAIESLIASASQTSPLYLAQFGPTTRFPVTADEKVIRLDVGTFHPVISTENCRKEQGVGFTVQCIALPRSEHYDDHLEAIDLVDEMARAVFEGLQGTTLNGGFAVDIYEMEAAMLFNTNASLYAGSYLDGMVNPE